MMYDDAVLIFNKYDILPEVEKLVQEFWHERTRTTVKCSIVDGELETITKIENIYSFDLKKLCEFFESTGKNKRFLIGFMFNWSSQDLIKIETLQAVQKEWHSSHPLKPCK